MSDQRPRTEIGTFTAHEATEESRARVRELAEVLTQEEVAGAMGFEVRTLQRHYAADYAAGDAKAKLEVKRKLLDKALDGSVNAIWKFLLMKRAITPQPLAGGGARAPQDLSRLSAEQLEQYGRLAAIAEGLDPDALVFEFTGSRP